MILDIKEAAKYLRLSKRSMERLVENDELPRIEYPGIRRLLFDSDDLDKWIKSCRHVPANVPAARQFVSVLGGNRGHGRR